MAAPAFDLRGRVEQYLGFSGPVRHAAGFLLRRVVAALRRGELGVFLRLGAVRDEAFAEWYQAVGAGFAEYESTSPVPGLVARARGVVLDLGPGIGNQLSRLDAAAVRHVYGLEPNAAGFAAPLAARLQADAPALEGRYELVPGAAGSGGAAALAARGVRPGDVDSVLCMQVLCSVSKPREAAREMYEMLRPGGEVLFWEHCGNADWVTWTVQWLYSLVWPVVCGGCRLDRDTKAILLSAGDWDEVEIEDSQDPKDLLPRVSGRLVKRRE